MPESSDVSAARSIYEFQGSERQAETIAMLMRTGLPWMKFSYVSGAPLSELGLNGEARTQLVNGKNVTLDITYTPQAYAATPEQGAQLSIRARGDPIEVRATGRLIKAILDQ